MPFQIIRNDIAAMAVDAIVNPTDPYLLATGGTDAAVHAAAGPEMEAALAAIGFCGVGEAVLTPGYRLPCKFVIHTVGPIWEGGCRGERQLLASCYRSALRIAHENSFSSIAFPVIASGSYGFPREEAQEIAIREIRAFLDNEEMMIYLVVYDRENFRISWELHREIESFIDDTYTREHRYPCSAPMQADEFQYRKAAVQNKERAPLSRRIRLPGIGSRKERRETYEAPHTPDLAPPVPMEPAAPMEDFGPREDFLPMEAAVEPFDDAFDSKALHAWISSMRDESFSQMLLRKIDESGMKDSECYKKANIDRKLFSKIRIDPGYRPSKPTVVAFAIALELSMDETRELLEKAGLALSHSSIFDIIVEYFITRGNYDIYQINEALFEFDQMTLGV